ncbi:hypothetical protein B0H10DRAFT_2376420 [Mycena sp. CBHHK59/15]|nr:hypothetical protein B0H10DRAFT_2376420 [Mycena sp. CBHHK59/15]
MVLHRNEHHHESALEAYKTAIDLMPKIAALSLNIQGRQAVVNDDISIEVESANSQLLNREWDKTVQVVQATVRGFEDFLHPKTLSKLQPAAHLGPVDILNAGYQSSHALIFGHSSNAKCVPLCPDITQEYIQWLARSLQALLSSGASLNSFFAASSEERSHFNICDRRLLAKREGEEDVDPEKWFRVVLEILWVNVVNPILTFLRIEKLDDPPPLWWCPTGSFSFLPIHAAGIYDEKAMGESASDYVISSYTPTVATLLQPRFEPFTEANPLRATVVIQPTTPGYSPLPQTTVELQRIRAKIPAQWVTSFGTVATPETVLPHLGASSIIHFACHGIQNNKVPLESALMIGTGRIL